MNFLWLIIAGFLLLNVQGIFLGDYLCKCDNIFVFINGYHSMLSTPDILGSLLCSFRYCVHVRSVNVSLVNTYIARSIGERRILCCAQRAMDFVHNYKYHDGFVSELLVFCVRFLNKRFASYRRKLNVFLLCVIITIVFNGLILTLVAVNKITGFNQYFIRVSNCSLIVFCCCCNSSDCFIIKGKKSANTCVIVNFNVRNIITIFNKLLVK